MGYTQHRAILVTHYKPELMAKMHLDIQKLLRELIIPNTMTKEQTPVNLSQLLSPLSPMMINGYTTFMIYPDGGGRGYDVSEASDVAREKILAYLRKQKGKGVNWVFVQYGDDRNQTKLLDDSDAEHRAQI